jgi:hypothetical protein
MAAKVDYAVGLEKFLYINTPDEIFREAGRAIINLSNAELLWSRLRVFRSSMVFFCATRPY